MYTGRGRVEADERRERVFGKEVGGGGGGGDDKTDLTLNVGVGDGGMAVIWMCGWGWL